MTTKAKVNNNENNVQNGADNLRKLREKAITGLKNVLGENVLNNKSRANIYHEFLFEGMTDKQMSRQRTKLRRDFYNLCEKLNAKFALKQNVNNVCKEFIDYYRGTYKVNDYSINSCYIGEKKVYIDAITKALAHVQNWRLKQENNK